MKWVVNEERYAIQNILYRNGGYEQRHDTGYD
jgi:hypothetical protein